MPLRGLQPVEWVEAAWGMAIPMGEFAGGCDEMGERGSTKDREDTVTMKILFACGGSGGHINPALGIANTIKQQHRDVEILFVGHPEGMEARLVPRAGYAFAPIRIQGFPRRLSWENIKRNAKAVYLLMRSGAAAKKIVTDFDPDVVVGTGGYVSGPILRTAAKLGYKTIAHESNAYPGLTTKFLTKYVDKVLLTVEDAKQYLPQNREYIVTGTPIRQELLFADRDAERKRLGVGERICVLSVGGSLGATPINEAVAAVMAKFQGSGKLHHIHATGKLDWEEFPDVLKAQGVKADDPHLDIREYIYDMAECIAAADIVISRCGAVTLAELECAGKAMILIPSPYLAENHQYHNAMARVSKNAAVLIEEKDLTGDALCRVIEELAADPQRIQELGRNASRLAIVDANKRICDIIYDLMEQ
ncbi:undecaprenyldiphospho-muramoylpentapeptide beta-N-acetylglucosaminyltransferase [Ruminococcaceae bacterium OttesenSCG-928-L11]|nr:undecaprenyldiphospho-muramoylpentapeptide beta-N-acetylglucosaminyltransferase [Ruminococcaceae bacterium OttesenSCG-928-L11]